jgi:hypothetical protein
MAVNLAAIAGKTAPLTFEFDGETVAAEFYPHRMTPARRAMLMRLDAGDVVGEESRDSAATMIADMLARWDVVAGDDPFPPTYDNLLTAPIELIGATARAIWDALGKRMSAESSD